MTAEHVDNAPGKPASRLPRSLWDGVLPDALGLWFVAIICGGFVAVYFIADYSWKRHSVAERQAEADTLAQALGTTLGAVAEAGEQVGGDLLRALGRQRRIRSVQWTAEDGSVRFSWPPRISAARDPTRGTPGAAAPSAAGLVPTVATTALHTPGGRPIGTLRVELSPRAGGQHQAALLWSWGLVAIATLLVFAAVYYRLRRHLRPVAAVERSLQSYAEGIEKELAGLALSDSLGSVAQGWNRLIEQLAETQRQVRNAEHVAWSQDVLTRFESAVFRRVVDRLPFGVLCAGENQSVSYGNEAAAALLGRGLDELVGRPVGDAIADQGLLQAVVGGRARPGAGLSVDHTLGEGDQETTLRFRVLSLSEESAGGVLITIEDISQLRESLRARDNFLYHVTHELRTPLTNIHAYAETLTKPGFDDEQTRKECYNVLISETRRMSRLVEDILSISQLEIGTARLSVGEVDLMRLIRQMVQDNLGAADEKRVDLTLALPPKVPKISGDKQRLSVLLNNLIGNAVKYTPEGGKVQVRLEVGEQVLRIFVADTGIGIAPEAQAQVFDKFYRATHDAVQMVSGTGLGLAIAREVARLHGGDIQLDSTLGQGSTFTVELPVAAAEHAEVSRR